MDRTLGLPSDPARMKARRAVTVVGVLIVACGLLLVGVTAYLGSASNASEVVQETRRLENAFDQGIADVLDQQRGIAWWDEAVARIANGFDEDFATSEFGIFLTETYGHDSILILDAADRPVFSFENGKRGSAGRVASILAQTAAVVDRVRHRDKGLLRPRPDNFAARQNGYQQLTGMEKSASWGGAILVVDGKPSIVSAITISPNVDPALLQGVPHILLSVVGIDQHYLDGVGRDLLLPRLRLTPKPATGALTATLPFVVDDNRRVGYLNWTTAAPGRPVLTTVLPLIVSLVLAIGAFSVTMLKRLATASHELELRAEGARREALLDPLSSMPNRQAFSLAAKEVLAAAGSQAGARVVIGYLDIDRFKDINDTLGHHMGDELICAFAERLKAHLAADDFLARIGGDEFAIIRIERSRACGATLDQAVAKAVATPITISGQEIAVTASLGLAFMPEHGQSIDVLTRRADIALYEAKRQGRDRTICFTPAMGNQFNERREIELALSQAVALDQLDLYFQPIVDERSGRIHGAETLLRWSHPVKGVVPPSVFIPIAEEAGLMPAIGEWVLRHAILQAGEWPLMELAVNLSPIQSRHADLVGFLADLCGQHGVATPRITLEITEGLLLDPTPHTRRTLSGLREAGFKVALDDFGTGFSSLNYLTTFRFDKLKIDQCFVRNIAENESARAIVRSVVQMGHALGMELVAEGVETQSERDVLRAFGCDHMQGYLFSRPLPAAGFIAFAASYNALSPAPDHADRHRSGEPGQPHVRRLTA